MDYHFKHISNLQIQWPNPKKLGVTFSGSIFSLCQLFWLLGKALKRCWQGVATMSWNNFWKSILISISLGCLNSLQHTIAQRCILPVYFLVDSLLWPDWKLANDTFVHCTTVWWRYLLKKWYFVSKIVLTYCEKKNF